MPGIDQRLLDRILKPQISEIRELLIPREGLFHDCRGFVVLETGDVIEIATCSPWGDEPRIVMANDVEPAWRIGTTPSRQSAACAGLHIVDIFRSSCVCSIVLKLNNGNALFMDSEVNDGMEVFHVPVSDPVLDDAISWISGKALRSSAN